MFAKQTLAKDSIYKFKQANVKECTDMQPSSGSMKIAIKNMKNLKLGDLENEK